MGKAVLISGMTELKILQPILEYFYSNNIKYTLIVRDHESIKRKYTEATLENIKLSSPHAICGANSVIEIGDFNELINVLPKYKIKKLLVVEAFRFNKILQEIGSVCGIYSICYFSDSCFYKGVHINNVARIYHTTQHCMEMFHKFYNLEYNKNRDVMVGSPIFDCLPVQNPGKKNKIILFSPNMFEKDIPIAFGEEKKFIKLMSNILKNRNVIIKSRKKQYMPKKIRNAYRDRMYYDADIVYPTTSSKLFKLSKASIMFYSSTIYEAVLSGQYIINCHISFGRWKHWEKVKQYMTPLYTNIEGLVENLTVDKIIRDDFVIHNKYAADREKAKKWIEKHLMPEIITNSYERIALDFLR